MDEVRVSMSRCGGSTTACSNLRRSAAAFVEFELLPNEGSLELEVFRLQALSAHAAGRGRRRRCSGDFVLIVLALLLGILGILLRACRPNQQRQVFIGRHLLV